MTPRPVIGINTGVVTAGNPPQRRYALNASYADAVFAAGGEPLLLMPFADGSHLPAALLGSCQGFLFSGGPDYPSSWYGQAPHPRTVAMDAARARFDNRLMEAALMSTRPVFGVCGGAQLLNIVCGGRLIQHLPQAAQHAGDGCDTCHTVQVCGGQRLRHIVGQSEWTVNSCHHQAVDPDGLGQGLVIAARADDGTVEAIEGSDDGRFLLGVQWHPERLPGTPHCAALFVALVAAASRPLGAGQ
jgi:putative glutamine amidotransferase